MTEQHSRLRQLSTSSPREALRLVYRKAVYRKVAMARFGVPAALSVAPPKPCELSIEMLAPDQFDRALGTSPHLTHEDVEHFRRQRSTCIIALDGEQIASSTWMTTGHVFISELQRFIDIPPTEHFSCRSYVDPGYRGRALLSHMIHAYSAEQAADDQIWGLVYDWNLPSVRSLERIGWRHCGDYWTRHILGVKTGGERHFEPRPPVTGPT